MIQYLQYKDIDQNKWDACIDKSLNGVIYAYSWYLNSACEQWDALVEDDYTSVMPLPFRKKMTFYYVFPPTMTQQLGIISKKKVTEDKVGEFMKSVPAKFRYCDINLNHYNPVNVTKPLRLTQHTNLQLDLSPAYAELLAGFSENTRRNIRKAQQVNINIQKKGNIINLIQLFENTRARDIKTLPDDFFKVVEKVSTQLLQRHQAEIWEASVNSVICAGVLFAFSRNKAYFLFSAATAVARENNIMHFLINKFIAENSSKDLVLDFEGSDNKNLARFYKSFGASEKNYHKIIINRLPGMLISLAKAVQKK